MKNLLRFHFLFLLIPFISAGQNVTGRQDAGFTENHAMVNSSSKKSQNVMIVWYNLENMYDTYDDTTTLDDEFTSKGIRRWTFTRFLVKLDHLSKTFMAIGGWEPPAIIGMCELENNYVLNKMIYETPLKKYNYKFIHYESTDARGIDVAMLYRPSVLKILFSKNITILFPNDSVMKTRDILYVKGILFLKDTVHFFLNHWPSRRGGFAESVPKRRLVAQTLRTALDTLQRNQRDPQIIIMGDFNDDPDQPAISEVLKAVDFTNKTISSSIVDLMMPKLHNSNEGTHKYQGKWAFLDQFMASGNLLLKGHKLQTSIGSAHIFHGSFLMEDDDRFIGGKPNRTYSGPRYTGGFSDHLPIYLDVWTGEE